MAWREGVPDRMFSRMALPVLSKPGLSPEILRLLTSTRPDSRSELGVIPLGLATIDSFLPDGGLSRGAVVEIAALPSLGQATSLALRACASVQRQAELRGGEPAWCAWLDPSGTLYAPGVMAHGVALDRLLVIRPEAEALSRIAVRVVASRVFSVVVVDTLGVLGKVPGLILHRWSSVVRRLALAIEGSDTSVVLLTDRNQSRQASLPASMRLEVEQQSPHNLGLRVAKERRGRISSAQTLAYARPSSDATPASKSA